MIVGNDGDDIVLGGFGSDTLMGSEGEDTLVGDDIALGDGDRFVDDTVDGLAIDDVHNGQIEGSDFDNGGLNFGLSANEAAMPGDGPGDDEINGEEDNDNLLGNDGDDTLRGGRAHDFLDGGNDDDQLSGGDGVQVNGDNDDILRQIAGFEGSDTLRGGAGFDIIDAGLNDDANFSDGTEGGPADGNLGSSDSSDYDFLSYTGSPFGGGDFNIDMTIGDHVVIDGHSAAIVGQSFDIIIGYNDLTPQTMDDIATVADSIKDEIFTDVTLSGQSLDDAVQDANDARNNDNANYEGVIGSELSADILRGNTQDNALRALAGNDVLAGGNADILGTGDGDDTYAGGAGNDTVFINDDFESDLLLEDLAGGDDAVDLLDVDGVVYDGSGGLLGRMAFVEPLEDLVVDALERGDDEQAAGSCQLAPDVGVLEDVLDLRRAVEGEIWEAFVHRRGDAERVTGAVEEIGVTERDVPCAALNELPDVLEDDVLLHDADSPVVDDRHRAVSALVHAAVARLDIADGSLLAVDREMRVALERGKEIAGRRGEGHPIEPHNGRFDVCRPRVAMSETLDPGDEVRLILATDNPIGGRADAQVAADRRVEAVETDR